MESEPFKPSIDWGHELVASAWWVLWVSAVTALCVAVILLLIGLFTTWGRQWIRITGKFFTGPGCWSVWLIIAALLFSTIMGVRVTVLISYYYNDLYTSLQTVFQGAASDNAAVRDSGINGFWMSIIIFLILTLLFGGIFLGVKAYEWHEKWEEHHIPGMAEFHLEGVAPQEQGHAQLFFSIYFAMTGLHALHMVIGVGILLTLIVQAYQGKFSASYYTPVDVAGLYWHFVDVIWIFLFPLLYLIDRHMGK